ncbi:LLM class flavin-dependent oxidoreductase [Nocardioides insulae]|uniref:LLM class flavin-dependent oxidoreductase n=1 Tax=Nocardioides insulae TaxID=394734 RepID=UPI000407F09E|nr:LLM class flavin-dependent oxidoreductase [Nocardioides insulae]
MRIGIVLLPEFDWVVDRERWTRAEEYGFDHAWTYDHLAWRTLADGPWHATIPTLVAAALSTERIRLGTLVTTPNYRHPVPLAKDLMTLDVISGGRLDLAVGAGAPGYDASVLGQPDLGPRDRHDRFEEFTAVLDRLFSQRVTDWSGRWYQVTRARMIPGPAQSPRPPILIAANGPRGMRFAAESFRRAGDGWVTVGMPGASGVGDDEWWAETGRLAGRMDDVLAAGPGPGAGFVRLLNMESRIETTTSIEHLRDHLGRAAALGFSDVTLAWPRSSDPYRGDVRLLDRIAEDLPDLRRIG